MLKLRSWLLLNLKQIKNCWRAFVIRKFIAVPNILLVDDLMMKLCNYWLTINKQTSLNKPISKQKLFKK